MDASDGLWWNTNPLVNGSRDFNPTAAQGFVTRRTDPIFYEYYAAKYMRAGTFTATLRLVDSIGVDKTATAQVVVNPVANTAPAAFAGNPYVIETGSNLQLAATRATRTRAAATRSRSAGT
jgi:hypothetical protein